MSNFNCKVKVKKTGIIYDVEAMDDFFGKHKYGYRVLNIPGEVFTEDEVEIILDNMKKEKEWCKKQRKQIDKLYKKVFPFMPEFNNMKKETELDEILAEFEKKIKCEFEKRYPRVEVFRYDTFRDFSIEISKEFIKSVYLKGIEKGKITAIEERDWNDW